MKINMESTVKRRRKKEDQETKKAGRPPIEEQTFLSAEMEDYCQLTRAGYSFDEICDELQIPADKLMRFQENSLVQARIRNLMGDRIPRIIQLQDELYEVALQQTIKLFKDVDSRKVPTAAFKDMFEIIKRFDPLRDDNEITRKLITEESTSNTNKKEIVNEISEKAGNSIFTKKTEISETISGTREK